MVSEQQFHAEIPLHLPTLDRIMGQLIINYLHLPCQINRLSWMIEWEYSSPA
jgi:hypothetical protein